MADASDIVEKYADKLIKVMGETAPEAWRILVRGQVITGIQELVSGAVCLLLAGFLTWCAVAWLPRQEWDISDDAKWPASVVFSLSAVGLFLWGVGSVTGCVRYLFAPEYMALQEMLR